jgi:hypothetical protein
VPTGCDADRVTDWVDWHRAYNDSSSSLARRLAVVQRRLAQALDVVAASRPRVLSLCAGDGRDAITVIASQGPSERASAILVEQDHGLAERAVAAAAGAGLDTVEVRIGDAGDPRVFDDVVPVDVLMLCGIFGNITDDDVARLIAAATGFVHRGGFVIWTRGASEPDMRPQVREWFRSAGFEELAFDGPPERYGVGLARLAVSSATSTPPVRGPLFTFVR